jgi:acyl-coenzyme A synthetase/AMP-(fatty) acid ligase
MLKVIPGKFVCSGKISNFALLKKIEAVFYRHPLVAEVAVRFTREHILIAFVVPRDKRLSVSELKKFLGDYLAPAELPEIYRFVAEIPKSLSGKCPKTIDRLTF